MPAEQPGIAAVILSFNGIDTLPEVIDAVAAQTVRLRRVIAVDNGSSDGTADYLRSLPASVETILLPTNTGVGAGHNAGWRLSLEDPGIELVWALEHDTIPPPWCLERLLETFRYLSATGLRLGTVWPGQVLPDALEDWRPRPNVAEPSDHAWSNGLPHLTTKLNLNGPLFSLDALRDVGLLREDFVVGQEDRELGMRLCAGGYAVVRDPLVVVGHRNKGKLRRGGRHSVARTYYGTRNGVFLLRQTGARRLLLPMVVAHAIGGAARSILREDHKRDRVRARLLGTRDGWRGVMGPAQHRFGSEDGGG